MIAKWLQILPVCIYKILAKRYCETITLDGLEIKTASKDVLIICDSVQQRLSDVAVRRNLKEKI